MTIFQRVCQKVPEYILSYLLEFLYSIKFSHIYCNKISQEICENIKFSILLPTYESNIAHLKATINSVMEQTYQNWELCISDDGSTDPDLISFLSDLKKRQKVKIYFSNINQNISLNTNTAAKLATGKYLCLLDHDDILWPNALYEVAKSIENNPNAKLIYTDEDKIKGNVHLSPFLKKNLNLIILRNVNFFNHFTIISRDLFNKLAGLNGGIEGAQDWDLYLRASKMLKNSEIVHIDKILYSWRISQTSSASPHTKKYAYSIQEKVLRENFPKIDIAKTPYLGIWQINNLKYPLPYQLYLNSLINLWSI